jgi:hypothetical protein
LTVFSKQLVEQLASCRVGQCFEHQFHGCHYR